MKIILNGACGRMGKEILRLCEESFLGASCVGKVDICGGDGILFSIKECTEDADVIIDFSNHLSTHSLLTEAVWRKIPVVLATTGQTEADKKEILSSSKKIPVFFCSNISIGIAITDKLVKEVASLLPESEAEIIEIHHRNKLDAPSGTALMLAETIKEVRPDSVYRIGRHGLSVRDKNEIGIHSVRFGDIVGKHEVIFSTGDEAITITHRANTRALFAKGALTAASFLCDKNPGLYSMKDIVGK